MSATASLIIDTLPEHLPKMPEQLNIELPKESNLLDLPDWLTEDYLQNCLRKYHKDGKLKLNKVDINAALGKGENYGGVLTRIRAEYVLSKTPKLTNVGHYIVKSSFETDEFARRMMEPYDLFNREMHIYENVLPKLNDLLREINDNEQIFAETMAVDYARSALIFEDLKVRDFVMPDRLEGLDMKLAKLVLRKLAKMHATSAVLNERENGCLEVFDRGMHNRHTNNYDPCFLGLFDACIRLLSNWQDFEQYYDKLQKLRPHFMEQNRRVFDAIAGQVNVLAHGDLWTNNVMVKYDELTGEPLDVILIDFQYSAWGSPAIDLHYFFNSSLKEDLHLEKQDELTQYYYYIFADTLRKLAYKANVIPSLHQFHMQMQQKAFYAVNTTCAVLPVQRNTETEDADFNSLMQENERGIRFKNTCYKNPYCQRLIRKLLPVFERQGLLDLYE